MKIFLKNPVTLFGRIAFVYVALVVAVSEAKSELHIPDEVLAWHDRGIC
jgi:hypothetical protein